MIPGLRFAVAAIKGSNQGFEWSQVRFGTSSILAKGKIMNRENLPLIEVQEIQVPKNQFHAQILESVNTGPVKHQFWHEKPKHVAKTYDWGQIEYAR